MSQNDPWESPVSSSPVNKALVSRSDRKAAVKVFVKCLFFFLLVCLFIPAGRIARASGPWHTIYLWWAYIDPGLGFKWFGSERTILAAVHIGLSLAFAAVASFGIRRLSRRRTA